MQLRIFRLHEGNTMKKCPTCGHETDDPGIKCPACGRYYSKIIELIDEEAQKEEQSTLRSRWRRIVHSGNVRQQLTVELDSIAGGLGRTARFSIMVVLIFIFALIVSVL